MLSAKASGVKFGCKPALNTYQAEEASRMLKKGKTQSEIGRLLGVSHQTIGRL
jgi:DNA invertase Pin-like site-specific DNA recombinase